MAEAVTTETKVATSSEHMIADDAAELQRGPQWLRECRHRSQQSFNACPVPPRGLHLWRYTDPAKFLVDRDAIIDTAFGENFDAVESTLNDELSQGNIGALAVDLGGRQVRVQCSAELTAAKVLVTSLSDAVLHHSELVEPHLYQLVAPGLGKFEAMNGAVWNDGIFVYVPDNTKIEMPLHLLREAGLNRSAQFQRLLVVVGDGSVVTVVDEYAGGAAKADGSSYSNAAVEIFGGKSSNVRYVVLQRQGDGNLGYLTHRARLDEAAQMLTMPLSFGGAVAKHNYGVQLTGRGAQSSIRGLVFGAARQHFDNHTRHHHESGQTFSDIDYKVVLKDRALSAYTGLIRIEQAAKTCEAYQENRNLLLDKGAKAETIPELEILNEDVQCSHGATIGPLDPLEVFYLQSRGIDKERAVRIIVGGFVESTLARVPGDLRDRIRGYVIQRLEDI